MGGPEEKVSSPGMTSPDGHMTMPGQMGMSGHMAMPGDVANGPAPHMGNPMGMTNNSAGVSTANDEANPSDQMNNAMGSATGGQVPPPEKAGEVHFEGVDKVNENQNKGETGNMKREIKMENDKMSIKYNEDVSKGFLSPPVFHLTEIMHNERCFKRTKGHMTVEINGDICIYGGMVQNKCVNNFIRYVPGINLFEKIRLNSEDITPRAFHSGNVISEDNKKSIVVFGGINENEEILDETFKFDFQAKKWERMESATKPSARYKHASFNFNDAIFVHGGLNANNVALSDLWCLSGGAWKEINQLDKIPEARYGHSLIFSLYGNAKLVFLFGGNRKSFHGALADTWIFNLNTFKWKEITNTTGPKPCARWAHSAQLFDNEWMIVYGGITNGWIDNYALSDMYALNIYTFSWFEVDISTSKSFNRGYYGSLCLVHYKKSLHVFGGSDETNEFSDAFSMSPLVTYVSYKTLTGKIEQLNTKMKNINENSNDSEHVNLAEFELKIAELKEDVNNINNMMKTFEMKFSALEKLNEQCEKLLSKNMNAEALEKLEQRIRKLESSNVLMKHDSI
ncbi:kelch domain-containing protein [Plasmodium vivax India VII]|uniref:Kelch domain-containing protein n=3 Tax=Plasmodium vivax TaxID=5855 RepID=A5K4R9_PLAVS|nr:kelch domain-containing protein [Plasmodium vivax]EDL45647.1 kelch domain-containing protein [Plasmodium vivax]KMZ80504.1 kelch domain-containing protein [Plasmodium vivax India VII]KMZ86609.1 kelch domain-containing protein [Plasmodium vivax Brazil I]CAI7720542.1 kelch domain-containing protein, putative [Plasmodium vivax]|eukprot:XP_001615374.1 kelch domain-containing protein [Plasmodium vivax Sal-1]